MTKRKKTAGDYNSLSSVAAKWVLTNISFVLFLGFLVTIYIANRHYSEKNIRDIQVLQEEVDRLRWKYLSLKSNLMKETKQSEVAKRVKEIGLSSKGVHPTKIQVED